MTANAMSVPMSTTRLTKDIISSLTSGSMQQLSPSLKLARQKRNAAVKAFEDKGIIKLKTDATGNQYIIFPWFPNEKIPYKSITLQSKLWNELCAGALGNKHAIVFIEC